MPFGSRDAVNLWVPFWHPSILHDGDVQGSPFRGHTLLGDPHLSHDVDPILKVHPEGA